ncbi:MAG TPA: metal-dependent transcriptional regulator [Lachnospiraceae bacterium]|jgi:Mn-dependent DtxR family transcriptional regulator|uniref:Iron (Metal) dependent repressor, DtxR family n=1 Tax=Anaerosporobacter mobilis DSM 15930 TaxID=1120996 RepID=A0A1M7G381_9FIRM|nr:MULTISPECIES: metal-dependent transcriptional regulator [Anaerosporobacter]SHM10329.1 iron (metal) dependent repressor, DtxR family [Anaerosporobacter mobilis DSM 15930]HAB60084.1 metal-dependent transcriptional regulator [Lachnospiraceae bacterium]
MKEKYTLTASQEDYLKQIYILAREHEEVRVTDVAKYLGLSKPSVNRAINTLKEDGFIVHEHYGTVKLTPKGEKAANNIYESYKVIRKFLIEVLEVDEETANLEADLMEHHLSKSTRKKWKKYLKKRKK